MGMFDLAWELEDKLSDVIEKFGGILKVKSDLTDLSPPLVYSQDEDMAWISWIDFNLKFNPTLVEIDKSYGDFPLNV